jgi:roadblock/LC7 domain-containing protein
MSEFDEVVACPGVLAAGRFEPDGRVAEHKSPGLHIANPALTRMAQGFCAAITTMFSSMAHAVDIAEQSGFDESGWLPLRSCTYSGGGYVSALHGDRFLIAERAKLGSLDDLNHLLHAGQA